MPEDKQLHFGWFLYWKISGSGRTQDEVAQEAEISARQLQRMFKMAEPVSFVSTIARIAKSIGMEYEELDRQWQKTPVSRPPFKETGRPQPAAVADAIVAAAGGDFAKVKKLLGTMLTPAQLESTIARGVASHSAVHPKDTVHQQSTRRRGCRAENGEDPAAVRGSGPTP